MIQIEQWCEQDAKVNKAFDDFHKACDQNGLWDIKTRKLLMNALACVFRCPHCTKAHIKKAFEVGATKQEVKEALLIASGDSRVRPPRSKLT